MVVQDYSNEQLSPRFCVNPECALYHKPHPPQGWYRRYGYYSTKAHGRVPRYQCKVCKHGFSAQTFHFTYYAKVRYNYVLLIYLASSCMSLRAIGRIFSPLDSMQRREGSVSHHLARLARQYLAMRCRIMRNFKLGEQLCADGIVNFVKSQYFKTQHHLVVGKQSQFIYFCDHLLQTRSGRMTDYQEEVNASIKKRYTFDKKGYQKSVRRFLTYTRNLFRSAGTMPQGKLFVTDEDTTYAREFRRILPVAEGVHHVRINSELPRTALNPLFSCNYVDKELRKNLHGFVRETTCIDRNPNDTMNRLMVHELYHNYLKLYRLNETKENRSCTHAEQAGISEHIISRQLRLVLTERAFLRREKLSRLDQKVWKRGFSVPFQKAPLRSMAGHICQ